MTEPISGPKYLPQVKLILEKIEHFEDYLNDDMATPTYMVAWEKNKKHAIKLNHLKHDSSEYLYNVIIQRSPKIILEIGTGAAYSTLIMSDALTQSNNTSAHIFTIEKSIPKIEIAQIHINESGFKNITLLDGEATEILSSESEYLNILKKEKVDLLFIDAHRKRYKDFLISCEPMLSKDSIIIADNITSHPEDVIDFVSYVKESGLYSYEIVEIGSGLLVAHPIKQ